MNSESGKLTAKVDFSRKWYVMAAVAMGIFLATIDGSIVNVALPTLVKELNTEFAVVQWVVLAYLLTITTLLLGIGRLADMIGKKPIYNIGFAIFIIGSMLCGLAPTVGFLITARILQAIGGAMMTALGTAIITEAFPPGERGKALGIAGVMVSLGVITGPTIGGLILSVTTWHWIFFVNVPVGLVGILLVYRYVPNLKPSGGQRFDFYGAGTLFVALLVFLLMLTFGQNLGFQAPIVWALGIVAVIFAALFLFIERRLAQPMVDLKLFSNPLLRVNLLTGLMTFIGASGTTLLMPFFFENVLGYDPQRTGLMMGIIPVIVGITAPISGAASDKYGPRLIVMIGLIMLFSGYIAVSTIRQDISILELALRFIPVGLGVGIFQSPNNSAVMGSAPRERLGIVSGMLAITRTLGQTSGIAILGAIWAGRVTAYSGKILEGGATQATPAVQTLALRDTLLFVVALIGGAMLLSIWGYWQERRSIRLTKISTETPLYK